MGSTWDNLVSKNTAVTENSSELEMKTTMMSSYKH